MSLTPEQLSNIPQNIIDLYSQLESFIIEDFARRAAKTGRITSTAEWISERANELGISMQLIEKETARILGLSLEEIQIIIEESASVSLEAENKIYQKAGLSTVKIKGNSILEGYIEAAIKQTKGELRNITKSLGFAVMENGKVKYKPIAKFYQDTLNLAQMKISTGVQDYNSAIKEAVKKITDSGLRYVDYDNGWSNHIDVAVRRSVLTSTNQMSQKINDKTIEDLDLDIVEVTAHSGARDKGTGPKNHKSWQGKWYSLSGKSKEYPSLKKVTGYGTGEGLGGYNCRHQYHGVIPDVSTPTYTDSQLRNIDPKEFGYKGKKYTAYEAAQYQRKIESAMRDTKRQLLAYKAAGLDDEYTKSSILLQRQKQEYKEFSNASGLRRKNERNQVIGFDKSNSQKAVSTYKKVEKEANKLYNLGNTQDNINAYIRDKPIRDKLSENNIEFLQRISGKEVIVKKYIPQIENVAQHVIDNMNTKVDRVNMTEENAQEFINNAKLVLYDTERETIKFLSQNGYAVLNLDNKLVTAVPQKWRNKYNKYIKGE
ncbi:phage minor capsid protein [Clostridium sp. 'White wine YQ']|uniref:phage minor capsid protein n=1 Tax=Clostridium sp. 'White wine YQ' TaxID=3027474 RepID=UPI00236603C7|nr:phage minor capsid protein [Clostridium sp. 'White wine YQ']MDD7793685.1 phage minor capsid protein [Clostridium sp. 'White wine YQ']